MPLTSARPRTGRPLPGEFADYMSADITAVPGDDAVEALERLGEETPDLGCLPQRVRESRLPPPSESHQAGFVAVGNVKLQPRRGCSIRPKPENAVRVANGQEDRAALVDHNSFGVRGQISYLDRRDLAFGRPGDRGPEEVQELIMRHPNARR